MPFNRAALLFGLSVSLFGVTAVCADDWSASKLRGPVMQLVDGQWQPLKRGMIVPDDRVVRTMGVGYVTFTRGEETIDLGPNTQIQIFDKAGKKPFTTVKEYFGTVAIEADVLKVQHFAVDTPYLAAVVKGTRFTVRSGKTGASVSVQRGHVAVEDLHDHSHVTVGVGQSATIDQVKTGGTLEVAGPGKLPAVLDKHGKLIAAPGDKPAKDADKAAKDAQKAADKTAKDAEKAADKAAKDAEKSAKDAAKSNSGPGGSGSSGNSGSGNSGPGDDKGKKDKAKSKD